MDKKQILDVETVEVIIEMSWCELRKGVSKDPNNHGKLGKSYGKRESKDIYFL